MRPQHFFPQSYDPEKLHKLQQVFDSVWEEFTLRHPGRDTTRDEELRTELAKTMVALADGTSDPAALGRLAIAALEEYFG